MKRLYSVYPYLFPSILVLVALVLCFKNYTVGTMLTGWDSLHPEFNFPLAFDRMFSGVWRADQGLGNLTAHSHMADLPRVALLWFLSSFIDITLLRYLSVFVCLILGPLGVYFFLKDVLERESQTHWIYPASFLGGLYYLLNLGTMQNFYLPFEMFTLAFALLPWLFWSGFKYLHAGGKRNFIIFTAFVIFASPMAYAATLWYVNFVGLFIFLISFALISSSRVAKLRRVLIMGEGTLLFNLYWLLPNWYSIKNQSLVIANSHINRLFSPEAFLRNVDYGTLANIIIHKNFLFAWRNFDFASGHFKNLLQVWITYLESPNVVAVSYFLAALFVCGILLAIVKKNKVGISLVPTLIFALFFLINMNPPFTGAYKILYENIGLIREGFRMPFTKFSILFELLTAFYFGYFIYVIYRVTPRWFNVIKSALFVVLVCSLIYLMLPAFSGELIGKNVRGVIPSEYQEIYKDLEFPEARIAKLPMHTIFNWEYHDWKYEGSAWYSWFYVKNPQLDRDFDRWSYYNEDFHKQASFALYSQNLKEFENSLQKYDIKYLLLDESIKNPDGTAEILNFPNTKAIIEASKDITKVKNVGKLTLYKTSFGSSEIKSPSAFIRVKEDVKYSDIDAIYQNQGAYIKDIGGISYPFVNLGYMRDTDIYLKGDGLVFENSKTKDSVVMPTDKAIKEDLAINRGFETAYNCDLEKLGTAEKVYSNGTIGYRATGSGVSCDYLNFPDLEYKQAYILRIAGENHEGRPLKIYFYNHLTKRMDLEELLREGSFDGYYIVYPKDIEGSGYTLNFETRSFGRVTSSNTLKKVEFYPVDWKFLSDFKSESSPAYLQHRGKLEIKEAFKYGTWAYKAVIKGNAMPAGRQGLLYLSQSYEDGWIAFQMSNEKCSITNYECWKPQVLGHTKVNSWANGWIVPAQQSVNSNQPTVQQSDSSTVYIIFWPQLLEWGGMLLGVLALVYVLQKKPLKA